MGFKDIPILGDFRCLPSSFKGQSRKPLAFRQAGEIKNTGEKSCRGSGAARRVAERGHAWAYAEAILGDAAGVTRLFDNLKAACLEYANL
jgi:hypothetical protein